MEFKELILADVDKKYKNMFAFLSPLLIQELYVPLHILIPKKEPTFL